MDHLSEPISGSAHLPIYRSKTKYGTGWSIDMTWTSRLRYRKLPSIESDIGDGPYLSDHLDPISVQEKKCGGGRPGRFRTKWTKSILRGNGWSSMRPSDIGDDSGPAIGSISSRSRRWRRIDSGNNLHLSAAALFACHAPERIRNIPGKR